LIYAAEFWYDAGFISTLGAVALVLAPKVHQAGAIIERSSVCLYGGIDATGSYRHLLIRSILLKIVLVQAAKLSGDNAIALC